MISNDLIQKIRKEIDTSPTAYAYFFRKLDDPKWIKPLYEAGYFKDPTPIIREGDLIYAHFWPESQYLARVADRAQDEVLEIVKDNFQNVDNERVMDDVLKMLLAVDVDKASRFTELVTKYVDTSHFFLLEKNVSDLVVKFAENGQAKAALKIAAAMLVVSEDPNKEAELKKDYVHINAHIKYGDYEYGEILKTITPALANTAPEETVKLYATLLRKTIDYEYTHFVDIEGVTKKPEFEDKKDDLSWIWRQEIASDDETYRQDPRNLLITALRDAFTIILRNGSLNANKKLEIIKSTTNHKYYVYKRIAEYVLRDYKTREPFKGFYDKLMSDDKLKNIVEHPMISSSGTVSYHATNILEGKLSDEDIVEKLKTYEPQDAFVFDRESVAKELVGLIKANPMRFAKLLPEIAKTKNEYLTESIEAFTDIIDKLTEDEIHAILESLALIYSVGTNEVEAKERHDYYAWSKSGVVRFVEKLTNQKEDKTEILTQKNIDLALGLILKFCKEPIDDEKDFDPIDLSINSIRGNAVHGLIYLLSWMRRNKFDTKKQKLIFDELDWHLDKSNDASPAIRSVYGWRFEFLYGTNKKWAEKNKMIIFSNDELGQTAFNAFVRFHNIHKEEITIMGDVLAAQLPRLKTSPDEDKKSSRHDAMLNFVHHIALLYWYFSVDLSKNSLMRQLLEMADTKYIRELTNFIGFRLYKKEGSATPEQLNKLKLLWTEVSKLAERDASKTEALEEFGTWFASGKFDDKWSLEWLTHAARKAKQIHLDFAALERMEITVKDNPYESIQALDAMVDGARERWAIDSWMGHAKAVLQTAYTSSNADASKTAEALANKLIAKGYLEYREVFNGTQ